jgi:hypothetical protein
MRKKLLGIDGVYAGPATHHMNSEPNTTGIVDAVLDVGRQRRWLFEQLRAALESGDETKALSVAKVLCGVANEECHRADSSFN